MTGGSGQLERVYYSDDRRAVHALQNHDPPSHEVYREPETQDEEDGGERQACTLCLECSSSTAGQPGDLLYGRPRTRTVQL